MKSRHCSVILLLLLACFVTYLNSLGGGFVFDDIYLIVHNPYVKDLRLLGTGLTKDLFHLAYEGLRPNYYRPLELLSFALDYRLWRLNPLGYHLVSLLWHCLNVVLVYVLCYLLFSNITVAAIASLLFSVHPINTAAVTYITGRADLLAAAFMLISFVCTILYFRHPHYRRWYAGVAVLCALLAPLGRENGIFIPGVVLLLLFFIDGKVRYKGIFLLATSLAIGVYLYFRLAILQMPLARTQSLSLDLPLKIINFIYAITFYLAILFVPRRLYLMHTIEPIHSLGDVRVVVALALFVAMAILWYRQRKNRFIAFGIPWFLILSSQVFFLMTGFYGNRLKVYEHWVYLATLGIYIIIAYVVYRLKRYFGVGIYWGIAFLVFLLALVTVVNNFHYKDQLSLSRHIIRFDPHNYQVHKSLINEYLGRAQYKEALIHLKKALRIAPFDAELYLLKGIYHEDMGDEEAAIASYHKVLALSPSSARAKNNLGGVYFNRGELDVAKSFFKQAISLNPLLFEPYLNLAKVYYLTGQDARARDFCQKALRLNPDSMQASILLARLYIKMGNLLQADKILRYALAPGNRDVEILIMLGVVADKMGFSQKARRYFSESLRIDPTSEEALVNLGIHYANNQEFEKAIEFWQRALARNPDNEAIKANIAQARRLLKEARD